MKPFLHIIQLILLSLILLSGSAWSQTTPGYELGAVMDTRIAHADGPRVLAITPGSAAESLGLKVGDRLVGVNGTSLQNDARAADRLQQAAAETGGEVTLVILRDGERLSVSGQLDRISEATVAGCGYISDNDPPPIVSEDIHPLEITRIDGKSTPLETTDRHRLTSGTHVLTTSERIAAHHFSARQANQRQRMLDRKRAQAYKAIVVEIEPGTRYSIGARLLRDSMDNEDIRNNDYWEPVIFRQRPEACQ